MSSPVPKSILIVGAGPAGLTLATLLLSLPLPPSQLPHITLLERNTSSTIPSNTKPSTSSATTTPTSTPLTTGQNIDIRGAGKAVIQHLNLSATIRRSLTNEAGVHFVDSSDQAWASYSVSKSGDYDRGTAELEILRGTLTKILFDKCVQVSAAIEAAGGKGVEFLFGEKIEGLEQHGDEVRVWFRDGGMRRFDIVVGADGLHSQIRKLAFGERTSETSIKPLGLFGAFFSLPSHSTDTAWRRWHHAPGSTSIMLRPSDRKDRSTVFITMAATEELKAIRRGDVEKQKEVVVERLLAAGWLSERLVRGVREASDFYWDDLAQVKLDRWACGRVVLLGDAGYCGSPFSGMGTTMALVGAYHLAGSILQHGQNYEAAFAAYEDKLRPLVTRAQKLPPGVPALLHPQTVWGVWILRMVILMLYWTGLADLMFKLKGKTAESVGITDYGFRTFGDEA